MAASGVSISSGKTRFRRSHPLALGGNAGVVEPPENQQAGEEEADQGEGCAKRFHRRFEGMESETNVGCQGFSCRVTRGEPRRRWLPRR